MQDHNNSIILEQKNWMNCIMWGQIDSPKRTYYLVEIGFFFFSTISIMREKDIDDNDAQRLSLQNPELHALV